MSSSFKQISSKNLDRMIKKIIHQDSKQRVGKLQINEKLDNKRKKQIIALFIDTRFFKIMSFSSHHDRSFDSKFFSKNFRFFELTLSLRHQFATFRNFESNIISFIQFFSIFFDNDQIARNVLFDIDDTTIEEMMNYTTNIHVDTLKTRTHFRFFSTNFVDLNFTTNDVERFDDFRHEKKNFVTKIFKRKICVTNIKSDVTFYVNKIETRTDSSIKRNVMFCLLCSFCTEYTEHTEHSALCDSYAFEQNIQSIQSIENMKVYIMSFMLRTK